ncbi:hypothetical protein GWA01_19860 [Gluconobacter wancherniae NBRC 103581]|uniref:Uncharacterized protein n=1 Tax=Gluconobacter wancherniae NBRC 103581 TaxID=656744 RepID=A0A511B186_9PROT|nr:hypothetical protein AA103581_1608 [Gluconobacter wancherniae NBRC 103581]GEK94216.1 hypothetical protein GWA01_19860 [Gluconobacter wancherniae NBRC 103581]
MRFPPDLPLVDIRVYCAARYVVKYLKSRSFRSPEEFGSLIPVTLYGRLEGLVQRAGIDERDHEIVHGTQEDPQKLRAHSRNCADAQSD